MQSGPALAGGSIYNGVRHTCRCTTLSLGYRRFPVMSSIPLPAACPLIREVEVAIHAARTASPQVLQYFRKGNPIEFKNGREPVTQADRAGQTAITQVLRQHFPQDSILSEEATDDSRRLSQTRVWIVDPVDGTQEFIEGLLQFVIMIGLSIDGEPKLGVLVQPGSGRLYVGLPGYGSFLVEHGQISALRVSARARFQEMSVALSRRHLTPFMEEIVDSLGFAHHVRLGSAGLKAALIAEQGADCYFFASRGMKEWDMCAPAAVLLGAGARLTDCWGAPLQFNQADVHLTHGFVASNGPQHQHIVEVIRTLCDARGIKPSRGFLPTHA